MRVGFTSRAVGDLEAVLSHYGDLHDELPTTFLVDFDSALERLMMFPNGAPPVEGFPGMRRARMRRFPYGIFYRPGDAATVVIRVLRTKQDRATGLEER